MVAVKKKRTKKVCHFPARLFEMMLYVEQAGLESIIGWEFGGYGIRIKDPELLMERVLPLFFDQTKYRSFLRQLNMWHFHRISDGPKMGIFVHPYFVRHNQALCSLMSRNSELKPSRVFATSSTSSNKLIQKATV